MRPAVTPSFAEGETGGGRAVQDRGEGEDPATVRQWGTAVGV